MKVGLTGGTGFIGKYLLRDYGGEIEFVVAVRNRDFISCNKKKAKYVESDFSVHSLRDIFYGCDAVIHMAGLGMPKNREILRMENYSDNILLCANVLEACKDIGIKKVIQTSSKAVCDKSDITGDCVTEDIIPVPADEYGVSKLCCEELAKFYSDIYGMDVISFRMSEVCGMDLNRGLLNPFWIAVFNSCIKGKAVPVYGKGATTRDLIYVKDVVDALVCGLKRGGGGIINIASGKMYTNYEIARMFCEVFDNKGGINLQIDKEEWGGTLKPLSSVKAKNELGFVARYGLYEIVKDIFDEYHRSDIGI